MLADLQEDLQIAWWAVFPALCIFGAVLTIEIVRRRLLASDENWNVGPTLT